MKKFKLFALAAFAMLSINAFATDYLPKNKLLYAVTAAPTTTANGKVKLVGLLDASQTSLTIPATITASNAMGDDATYDVTAIDATWETAATNYDGSGYQTFAPAAVTAITINAPLATVPSLTGCTALTKLTVAYDYSATGDVTIGDGNPFVTTIKEVDLSNLKGKTKVIIGEEAFYNNAVLEKVTLPAGAVEVGNKAFGADEKLATIDTKGITAFGNGSFSKCSKLAAIDLSAAKTIGSYAFYKTAAKTLTIPANVESISSVAFGQMAALEEVTINGTKDSKLTTIPSKCFDGCAKLVKVTINAPKVATIDAADAFPANAYTNIDLENSGLDALTNLDLSGAKESLTEIKLPANDVFTAIAADQFKGFTALTAITIPEKVTSIGKNAFDGATALATVTIAGKVNLDKFAFANCAKLATVTGGLTKVPAASFVNCELLESIDLSEAAGTIGEQAFNGCKKLATITISDKVNKVSSLAFNGTVLTEFVAPGVTTILADAFGELTPGKENERAENKNLKKFEIGAALGLESWTLANCTALESATIGFDNTADAIPANFFYGCTALKSFDWDCNVSTTVASINNDAFDGCTPNVVITTSNAYMQGNPNAPKFCIYGSGSAKTFKTVADASGAAAAYGLLYDATNNLSVSASDAKVYTVYVDRVDNIAYFTAMLPSGGKYNVQAGTHAILKTDAPKENIPVQYVGGGMAPYDNVFTVTKETEYATFLTGTNVALNDDPNHPAPYNYGTNVDLSGKYNAIFAECGNYLYRLSNNGSFGFSAYKKTLKPGQYYILLKTQPAAGRLQTVWLDENGNVENEATGINSIVEKSENAGVTYNLAGQKVRSGYKGVVIRNGKKMILK